MPQKCHPTKANPNRRVSFPKLYVGDNNEEFGRFGGETKGNE
jgi:hypothetical protein